MKRAAIGLAIAIVVGLVVTAFSMVWLVWFAATMLSVGIFRWKALPESFRKVVAGAIALALVSIMWIIGGAPNHANPGSAAESRVPFLGAQISSPPTAYARAGEPPKLDELGQTREDFRREVFRLRAQSNVVELALSLKGAADRAIDYGQRANIPIPDLLDAKATLARALDARKIDSVKNLDETKDALDKFLGSSETKIAAETTVIGARRLLTDFRLQARKISIDDVNDATLRLEAALNRIGKDVIGGDLRVDTLNRIRIEEGTRTLVRDEIVSFSIQKFPLKTIDASEILIGRDPETTKQELLVYFGDNESAAEPPADAHQISIRPGIRKVTLIKRSVLPSGLTELPSKLHYVAFRYLLLKWSMAFPAKLRVVVDLSAANLGDAYPFYLDTNTDAPIKEIRVPLDSLFNASIAFKTPRREGEENVLEPETTLTPSYFLTHNFIWIELMPDTIAFRNKQVQEWKQYLFVENLWVAIAVMTLGFLCALVVG